MAITQTIYSAVFKRTSTYVVCALIGAYFVEAAIDRTAEYIFNEKNKGKLWHHIRDNYAKEEEE